MSPNQSSLQPRVTWHVSHKAHPPLHGGGGNTCWNNKHLKQPLVATFKLGMADSGFYLESNKYMLSGHCMYFFKVSAI